MKISWKNIENWRSWKMRVFWGGHFEISKSAILIFFRFISVKKVARLYEVSFFSALWMVFPESWKRSCPNFYAHDCRSSLISVYRMIVKWHLSDYFSYLVIITKFFRGYRAKIMLKIFHWLLGDLKTPKRHFEINWPSTNTS